VPGEEGPPPYEVPAALVASLRRALGELFGIPLSSGTVAALTARAAGRLVR
jgi:hypothetical protein